MDDQNNPTQTPQNPTPDPATPVSGGMPASGGMEEPVAPTQSPTMPEPTMPEPTMPEPAAPASEPTGGMGGGTMPSAGDAPAGGPAMPSQPAVGGDASEDKPAA